MNPPSTDRPSTDQPSTDRHIAPDAWDQLVESLTAAWPTDRWASVGVLIGCSGGADSVALVRTLHQIRQAGMPASSQASGSANPATGFLVVAHFDHAIRGVESAGDRDFVIQLANDLGIEVVVETGDASRTDEAHLRQQRYDFLQRAAAQTGCRYIALAHSLDDNVETVLHHLMRGTGPAGLAGIAPARPASEAGPADDFVILRPLLSVRRDLIRAGLRKIGQTWREDSSNGDVDYQRNWIRAELLPLMQSRFPNVIAAVGRAIESQREWRVLIDQMAQRWIQQHVSFDPLTLRRSGGHDAAVVIAALQSLWQRSGWSRTSMMQRHWRQLADTLRSDTTQRYNLPGEIDVVADKETLVIQVSRPARAENANPTTDNAP